MRAALICILIGVALGLILEVIPPTREFINWTMVEWNRAPGWLTITVFVLDAVWLATLARYHWRRHRMRHRDT